MNFPFPDIKSSCPICSSPGCAIAKGYYQRRVFCPDTELNEMIAIHVGRCSTRGKDFSFLPEFLVPYRWISRRSLSSFFSIWLDLGGVEASAKKLTERLTSDEWYVTTATAWSWLKLILVFCRLNWENLCVPDGVSFEKVSSLRIFSSASDVPLLHREALWPRAFIIVKKPP